LKLNGNRDETLNQFGVEGRRTHLSSIVSRRDYAHTDLLQAWKLDGGSLRHLGNHAIKEEATAAPAISLGKMTGLD
jgi:hypothetical protein